MGNNINIMDIFYGNNVTAIVILVISILGCAAQLPTVEGKPRIPINTAIPDGQATRKKWKLAIQTSNKGIEPLPKNNQNIVNLN